jgi:hypothetical protein
MQKVPDSEALAVQPPIVQISGGIKDAQNQA